MRRARRLFWVLLVFGACVGLALKTGTVSSGEGAAGKEKVKGGKAVKAGKPAPRSAQSSVTGQQ